MKCNLDTGADVSCIPMMLAAVLMKQDGSLKLEKAKTRLCSYFDDRYACESTVRLPVRYRNICFLETFYVLNMNATPTLSGNATERLQMIARVGALRQKQPRESIDASTDPALKSYIQRFPAAFNGEGRVKNYSCHITLKPNYTPVANTCRPIPVAFQRAAREELQRMIQRGITTEVREPTEFVSHIVLAKNTLKSDGSRPKPTIADS